MPDPRLQNLTALLGCDEPLGILYTEDIPEHSLSPVTSGHGCLINYMRIVRSRRQSVHFSTETTMCMGGRVYLGYLLPPPERIAHFVTTGYQGGAGEHYLPRPESMDRFFADLDIQPAPAPYCVVRPYSMFEEKQEPDLICFHARGEALTGLISLASFALDDHHAVAMPFGSGCANIFAWPLHYRRQGQKKAVVGGADPSCRPYLKVDEMTFTVTADILMAMLDAYPQSFLMGNTWNSVRKKVEKSSLTWDE